MTGITSAASRGTVSLAAARRRIVLSSSIQQVRLLSNKNNTRTSRTTSSSASTISLLRQTHPTRSPSSSLSCRYLTTSQQQQLPFSSYEYPLRTEAPTVTRTTAAEAAAAAESSEPSSSATTTTRPPSPSTVIQDDDVDFVDHFDDSHTLSSVEREACRAAQQEHLVTTLPHHEPIQTTPPSYIPPNYASTQLDTPTTLQTCLPNGIRVVSQETYSQVSCVGVLFDVGSRVEEVNGTCHLLELLAFHSTRSYPSALDILQQLQDQGGTSFQNTSREQLLYCVDILRVNTEWAMKLLQEVVLHPQFTQEEVEECKMAIEYQNSSAMMMLPEVTLQELLQEAAYGKDQQLGKPHFCPTEALPYLNSQVVHDFHQKHMMDNPQGLVVAGAGIQHDELLDMATYHFGHLQQQEGSATHTIPSTYRGGYAQLQTPNNTNYNAMDNFTRIGLAFELGGWHSDDLVPTCVLQTLLGGGNSFSAGGPGKGMYSRLYRQVLNRYYWAESAEAFTAFHSESGLFGISGSSMPTKSRDVTRVLAEHFAKLAVDLVSDEEFDRARNMLKCNVLTQLESRLVLFEDMGRQVLTYGHREDIETMSQKIDAVTKEELRELAQRALKKPPTLAAVGDDLSNVPSYEEVAGWFQ